MSRSLFRGADIDLSTNDGVKSAVGQSLQDDTKMLKKINDSVSRSDLAEQWVLKELTLIDQRMTVFDRAMVEATTQGINWVSQALPRTVPDLLQSVATMRRQLEEGRQLINNFMNSRIDTIKPVTDPTKPTNTRIQAALIATDPNVTAAASEFTTFSTTIRSSYPAIDTRAAQDTAIVVAAADFADGQRGVEWLNMHPKNVFGSGATNAEPQSLVPPGATLYFGGNAGQFETSGIHYLALKKIDESVRIYALVVYGAGSTGSYPLFRLPAGVYCVRVFPQEENFRNPVDNDPNGFTRGLTTGDQSFLFGENYSSGRFASPTGWTFSFDRDIVTLGDYTRKYDCQLVHTRTLTNMSIDFAAVDGGFIGVIELIPRSDTSFTQLIDLVGHPDRMPIALRTTTVTQLLGAYLETNGLRGFLCELDTIYDRYASAPGEVWYDEISGKDAVAQPERGSKPFSTYWDVLVFTPWFWYYRLVGSASSPSLSPTNQRRLYPYFYMLADRIMKELHRDQTSAEYNELRDCNC